MFTRFSLNPAKTRWRIERPAAQPMLFLAFRILSHTLTGQSNAKGGKRRRTKQAQRFKPASGKPLHIDCVFGTPENWRVRRGSANARLGHAYPWYATYSSHIPASLRAFPTKKTTPARTVARANSTCREKGIPNTHPTNRPDASEGPERMARRSRGIPARSQTKPPRADEESPGRMPHVGGRERPTRDDRQSAPWREEDAQGALAFRIVYLSFGASFTSCPRLATTGMVIALAGQASTQALQRVQSASVRSP